MYSGVWDRNSGKPRAQLFERIIFAAGAAGAHDVLIADIDGEAKPDVVMMGDERTKLNALCWYSIPSDPRQPLDILCVRGCKRRRIGFRE